MRALDLEAECAHSVLHVGHGALVAFDGRLTEVARRVLRATPQSIMLLVMLLFDHVISRRVDDG